MHDSPLAARNSIFIFFKLKMWETKATVQVNVERCVNVFTTWSDLFLDATPSSMTLGPKLIHQAPAEPWSRHQGVRLGSCKETGGVQKSKATSPQKIAFSSPFLVILRFLLGDKSAAKYSSSAEGEITHDSYFVHFVHYFYFICLHSVFSEAKAQFYSAGNQTAAVAKQTTVANAC